MTLDLPDKMWQSANAITAFVVIQAIAYLYVSSEPHMQYALHKSQTGILAGIVVFHCIYAWVVHQCHKKYQALVHTGNGLIENEAESHQAIRLSKQVRRGQIAAIILFGIFASAITFYIDWNEFCRSYVAHTNDKVECKNVQLQPSILNKLSEW